MCNRRNKPICQGAIFFALLGGLGYTCYMYSIISMDLEISRSEAERYLRKQESLSSQLQVVYEHRARLERSLQKEKTDHKNTKLDFSKKKNEFLLNITRSKHEAMNRFNSLETQHNMLKAEKKELGTDYSRLQQQYYRLSSEQSNINSQQKRNFQLFKEQKANEIASLDEEIKTLKQQVVALRTHIKTKSEETEQYKLSSSQELQRSQQYQETIRSLQEELASYKERLKRTQQRSDKSVKEKRHDKDKTPGTRQRGGNLRDSHTTEELTQEEKDKSQQEEGNHTGSPGMESRHADKHTSPDRHRHQTSVPATLSSKNDADDADEREPADANQNEQRQNDYDKSYSHQTRDDIHLGRREESKRTENSLSEGQQNHDNVPLRDSNDDIRNTNKGRGADVASPTDSESKWADIIKAAQKGQKKDDGDKKDDNTEAIEEEGEDENEGERHKRSVDEADNFRTLSNEKQSDDQRQTSEEEGEARGLVQQDDRDGRRNEQGYQADNVQRAHDQYKQRDRHSKEEAYEGDPQDTELSRKNINKQVAEMQEDFHEKQIQQQQQHQQDQEQQRRQHDDVSLSQNEDDETKESPAAVQRQDTAQEHREKSDADNDDEDGNTEQDTEQDPDDVDEVQDSYNMESHEQRRQLQQPQQVRPIQGQQGQHHRDRAFDRTLKHA